MDLMDARRQIMTAMELPPLPDAYQKVDYVVGTSIGTNFDSGVAGNNNNLRIKGCISFITATGGYHAVLGNYASETKNAWRFMLPAANIEKDRILSNQNTRANGAKTAIFDSLILGNKVFFDLSRGDASATMKNQKIDATANVNGDDNNKNIAIGASYVRTSTAAGSTIRYYYFKFYDNGTLIRCYVPCYRKSDNKVGFYDTVNDTFNYATGGVDFTLS